MKALEVIWIDDDIIRPPGPKMVVCVEPHLNFFFRINSNDNWQPCIPIARQPDHMFLKWDSFIQCSILVFDDYIVDQSLRRKGIIGSVSTSLCSELLMALGACNASRSDRNAIRAVLEPLVPSP
jgi:hypothetical protein